MKNTRVYLNLGFFALLGIVMTVWAFSTIIKLDAIEQPYRVQAEFVSSPGLIRGFDVAYLGVRVGKIGDVRLAPGKIVVGLDIDKEIRLPQALTAEVRRKSAIGEPYVELSPPAGGLNGRELAPGDTIPLAKTTVPLDYKKLFEGVGKLLDAVPPKDAKTITHELSEALNGRAPAIRSIIGDAHEVTGTLADNAQVLDELSVELTQLTHTLAGRKDKLASGITNTELVTGALADSRHDLNAFLDQGPGVFAKIDGLLNRARPGLSCLLTAAGTPHKPIFSAESERHVRHLLSTIPTALSFAADISDVRDGTTYGRNMFVFSVPGGPEVAEEYAEPLGPPTVPTLRACPKAPAGDPADSRDDAADDRGHPDAAGPDDGTQTDGIQPDGAQTDEARPVAKKSPEARKRPTAEPSETSQDVRAGPVAANGPLDHTPLIAAIFLAVTALGGIVGWVAVGRSARRRETESS
ncbi:MCE family protein [Nonomuraea sp. NBC_01738]|uniref:MlaD family protein n=1 Tax=Nonomuraea sp. NBC_01738 TaxID=2976003 RepID=UPI002E11D09C|nr:MCE family protein [Nonomuraea sp. NBC_01738]